MVKIFPNLMKTTNPHIQEAQWTTSKGNKENHTKAYPNQITETWHYSVKEEIQN